MMLLHWSRPADNMTLASIGAQSAPTVGRQIAQGVPSDQQHLSSDGATLPERQDNIHGTLSGLSTGDQREAQPVGKVDENRATPDHPTMNTSEGQQ